METMKEAFVRAKSVQNVLRSLFQYFISDEGLIELDETIKVKQENHCAPLLKDEAISLCKLMIATLGIGRCLTPDQASTLSRVFDEDCLRGTMTLYLDNNGKSFLFSLYKDEGKWKIDQITCDHLNPITILTGGWVVNHPVSVKTIVLKSR